MSNCGILGKPAGLSASVSSSIDWGHDPSSAVLTGVVTITQHEGCKSRLLTVRRLGLGRRVEGTRSRGRQSGWCRTQRLWEGRWLLPGVRREPLWGSGQGGMRWDIGLKGSLWLLGGALLEVVVMIRTGAAGSWSGEERGIPAVSGGWGWLGFRWSACGMRGAEGSQDDSTVVGVVGVSDGKEGVSALGWGWGCRAG